MSVTTTIYTYYFDILKYTGTLGDNETPLENATFELRLDPAQPETALTFYAPSTVGAGQPTSYLHSDQSDPRTGVSQLVTPASGMIRLGGLDAGTYYLVETEAPPGFNLLPHPIRIEIIYTGSGGIPTLLVNGEPQYPRVVNVQNNAGTTLPETGGIGNTIFIIIGLSIMAAAVILFATKRKKPLEEAPGELPGE